MNKHLKKILEDIEKRRDEAIEGLLEEIIQYKMKIEKNKKLLKEIETNPFFKIPSASSDDWHIADGHAFKTRKEIVMMLLKDVKIPDNAVCDVEKDGWDEHDLNDVKDLNPN
uniref:Uncharacterized protein n=1 Tax=viral metagenome TaxID=1070528 RepID=A0A6M3IGH7_9ZZZZ